jgi:hypothetical protein
VLRVHQRPDLRRRILRVADDDAGGLRRVACHELVVHLALHEDP